MNIFRIFWSLVFLVWGLGWGLYAPEVSGFPQRYAIGFLILGVLGFYAVPGWWVPRSGITFFVGCGAFGTLMLYLWNGQSPLVEYHATGYLVWLRLSLAWGYGGTFLGKAYMSWEAQHHPEHIAPNHLARYKGKN